MDAAEFAEQVKRTLQTAPNVKAVQRISPELIANKQPIKPRAALQVEIEPHQTFIVCVY